VFDGISPTNGTFPPNKERTIPNPSNDIITLVREQNVALVQALGDAGIVGLIAAIIILGFYK
jgi:hypothetical protein